MGVTNQWRAEDQHDPGPGSLLDKQSGDSGLARWYVVLVAVYVLMVFRHLPFAGAQNVTAKILLAPPPVPSYAIRCEAYATWSLKRCGGA